MDNLVERQALGEAARWCARLAAHDCSEVEHLACERWQSAKPEHRNAFVEVSRTSADIDRAMAVDARLQQLADRALAANVVSTLPPAARIKRLAPLALAASVVLAAVVAWQIPAFLGQTEPQALVFQAPSQHARQVTLADGSVVSIDAGGKLRATLTHQERRIELLAGRAYFDVAHDKSRPFSVVANDVRTVALGTRFEVRMDPGETNTGKTTITLAQGSVQIEGARGAAQWRELLTPGEQLRVEGLGADRERRVVDAEEFSSWARGWLVFHGMPLHDALREINRYSEKKVLLADASLADLSIAGRFFAGDSASIVAALAEVLPIRVVDGGSHEIMLFKRYD
ncbi:MAG TPA: FecR domain-containing protein [Steroidobacteraceae bacterium]|nr:FecR domain-containing protein [Steroidobacteraceae bacterium]